MGRKLRGAAFRTHKRGKVHADEIVEQKAVDVEQSSVVKKSNEQLFVIDTKGDSKAVCPQQIKQNLTKRQVIKVQKQAKSSLPLLDQKRVEKLVQQHDARQLRSMLKESQDKMRGDRRAVARNQQRKKKIPNKFDLWGDEEEEEKEGKEKAATTATATTKKLAVTITDKREIKEDNAKKEKVLQIGGVKGSHVQLVAQPVSKQPSNAVAVDVAHAGQSYRPDPKQYNEVVQDAVALELRRQQAQDYNRAPLAAGMSAETRALLVGDSEEEDDESEDDGKDDNDSNSNVLRKRRDKLTRAQRNKQKRLRVSKAIEDKQRRNKKLLNSISEIPRYKKEIKTHEKELTEKRERLQQQKEKQNQVSPAGKDVIQKYGKKDPINVPTLPVALQTEHQDSSLRTMKPKGSLITDRMASFVDRNLVSKRKMGDKKRIMQGKRRKLNIKGNRGHDIIKAMNGAILG